MQTGQQAERRPTSPPRSVDQAALKRSAQRGPLKIELGWFHRYPARFASEVLGAILAGVLRRIEGDLQVCLDPFAGTGATIAACRQIGVASIGIELSQLGVEISRLRLEPPSDVEAVLKTIEAWTSEIPPSRSRVGRDLEWWLGNLNARCLTGYLSKIPALPDESARRFARVAVSQSLRPASRWLAGSVKVTADPTRTPPPIGDQLRKWARVIAQDCINESARSPRINGAPSPATTILGDARFVPLAAGTVDAVVTSPPYFVTYDYFEVNRLSYLAFGWDQPRQLQVGVRHGVETDGVGFVAPQPFKRWYKEFGEEQGAFGRALRAYSQSLRVQMAELFRVVRPGGIVAYAVANSTRKERSFELAKAVRDMLSEAGFVDLEIAARGLGDRHILPVTRDSRSGQFATEGIAGVSERIVYAHRPPHPRRRRR